MRLTKNFADDEFRCPYCGKVWVDGNFILGLQKARDIAGIPFHINSGCRCVVQNMAVGGTEDSSHILGCAADIQARTSAVRWVIEGALRVAGFQRIGIRKTFIHVDSDDSKAQGVLWLY